MPSGSITVKIFGAIVKQMAATVCHGDGHLPQESSRKVSRKCLKLLAEGVGFEPTVPCGTTDFESVTFDLSDTPPGVRLLGAGDWGLAKAQPPRSSAGSQLYRIFGFISSPNYGQLQTWRLDHGPQSPAPSLQLPKAAWPPSCQPLIPGKSRSASRCTHRRAPPRQPRLCD